MDDPWGSPWATADADNGSKPPSPNEAQLELPRPTFAKLPSFSTHSPWGDQDDGFGDWASADQGTTSGNGWGAWTGENGSNSSQQLTPLPRDETLDKASPIAWPGSIATSPNFNVKQMSRKASSVFRQPSPDPWATEFSLTKAETAGLSDNPNTVHAQDTVTLALDEIEHIRHTIEKESIEASPDEYPSAVLEINVQEEEESEIPKSSGDNDQVADAEDEETTQTRASTDESHVPAASTVQSIPSRPSSPDSIESHHDEERQDSPITSIDEDSRSRLQVPRKSSYKVQELVEKFDALAKTPEDVAVIRSERSRSRTPRPDIRADETNGIERDEADDADFGDFEDAVARLSPRPSMQEAVSAPTEPPSTKESVSEAPSAQHVPLPDSRPATSSGSRPQSRVLNVQQLVEKFGPIKFDTNLQDVDKLFDAAKLAALPVLESDSYVPDYVVNDSFTDISERKTWYRISRQGTMRKHNLGNDDNYRRVGWLNSTARLDTIKIVRRWMEEDSFSGRPTLGGSSSKGHGFGWDSGAEPVTLDQVFGKKRAKAHTKSASAHQLKPPAPTIAQSTSQPLTPNRPPEVQPLRASQGSGSQPSMTQFGWSTAPAEGVGSAFSPTPATVPQREPSNAESTSRPRWPQMRKSSQSARPLSMPPPAAAPLSIPGPAPATQEDEDDEWGDMVMSPAENTGQPGAPLEIPERPNGPEELFDASGLEKPLDPARTPTAADVFKSMAPATAQNLGSETATVESNPSTSQGNGTVRQSFEKPPLMQDPWGFADFSAFEATGPSTIEQKSSMPITTPALPAAVASTQLQASLATPKPPTPIFVERAKHFTEIETDETRIVYGIIRALPDLSYMLR